MKDKIVMQVKGEKAHYPTDFNSLNHVMKFFGKSVVKRVGKIVETKTSPKIIYKRKEFAKSRNSVQEKEK